MADLRRETMQAWYDKLPDDVRSAMPDGPGAADDVGAALTEGLKGLSKPEDILAFVEQQEDSFVAVGRARRIRFLAWFARRTYPHQVDAFDILTDGESGDGGQGTLGKVAPVFLEDVRALVEALGPRAARGIVDAATIAAVAGAGYEVASEMEMRQGGTL